MTSPLEIIRAAALVVQPLATGDFTWFVRVTTTQPEVCELACSAQSFDSWVGALNAGTLALKALELSATDLRQRTIQPDDLAGHRAPERLVVRLSRKNQSIVIAATRIHVLMVPRNKSGGDA